MKKNSANKQHLILLVILIFSAILRFYNLNWGTPYYFHPDERNMAHAITQLRLPDNFFQLPSCFQNIPTNYKLQPTTCNLNPRFFAYGQFPLYLSFFSAVTGNFLANNPAGLLTFPQAIIWLRFWSALTSTLTVLLVFLISRKLFNFNFSLLASALCAAAPGLIQSAHFGTTESLLTFFFMLLIYLSIMLVSDKTLKSKFLILTSIVLGLAISTKISALIYFPVTLLAIILASSAYKTHDRHCYKQIMKAVGMVFLTVAISLAVFTVSSPFNFLDFRGFMGSMNYESAVATGEVKVFYTRQFENTLPVFFQITKIFPYALGIPIFLTGSLGFLLMCINLIVSLVKTQSSKFKVQNHSLKLKNYFILTFSFLIFFLPNAFLFAKWTRFMTPVFPLFAISAAYLILLVYNFFNKYYKKYQISKIKYQRYLFFIFNFSFLILLVSPGFAFFTIYTRPDSRVQASQWIYDNIPSRSYVLSETANVIDIPLFPSSLDANHYSLSPISFNFYELDENPARLEELLIHLELADYIFVPSRRIFTNHLIQPDTYPLTSKYYELLFSGRLGFEKIAEISSFPQFQISNFKFQIVDEDSEESFTVFDHPVIRIYQKIKSYSFGEYQKLLTGY